MRKPSCATTISQCFGIRAPTAASCSYRAGVAESITFSSDQDFPWLQKFPALLLRPPSLETQCLITHLLPQLQMARTLLSRRGEAPYTDQPVETILEQLLQSPPPEQHAGSPAQLGGALSVARKEKLPSAKLKTPDDAVRKCYRPQERPSGRANTKRNGSLTGKFALAAASPVTLASNTARKKDSRTSEDTLNLSSATSETYSNASVDSVEVFARTDEKQRAGLQIADKEPPRRTYWPKYSDDNCFIVAVSHAPLDKTEPLPHKSVHTVSTKPQSFARPRAGSKALPLPIAIASPKGVIGKAMNVIAKPGRMASRDSTPPNWSSSASTTSDESGQEVSFIPFNDIHCLPLV